MRDLKWESIDPKPKKCKRCASTDISPQGTRAKTGGRIRMYFCEECFRYFPGERVKKN